MKIEIEDRANEWIVNVDKQGSAYHGENICPTIPNVLTIVEEILRYDM